MNFKDCKRNELKGMQVLYCIAYREGNNLVFKKRLATIKKATKFVITLEGVKHKFDVNGFQKMDSMQKNSLQGYILLLTKQEAKAYAEKAKRVRALNEAKQVAKKGLEAFQTMLEKSTDVKKIKKVSTNALKKLIK